MKYIETLRVSSGEPLPENLVKIFDIKIITKSTWTTPEGSGCSYEYVIHALMDDTSDRTIITEEEEKC